MTIAKLLTAAFIALALCAPTLAGAQGTLVPDTVTMETARVTAASTEQHATVPDTGTSEEKQQLTAQVVSGPDAGKGISVENDYAPLSVGDLFYLSHTTNAEDGTDYYSVSDAYRLNVLAALFGVFLLLLVLFGGLQGLRGLLSLIGSIVLIVFALVPGILHGFPPLGVSLVVASLIIILGSYITHGFNRTTSAAVLGMVATVLITGALAYWSVSAAHFSGYSSEEMVYLNFNTHGAIDMVGLLMSGIMIGLLGVLYDIAIGQAIAVEELYGSGAHMTRARVWQRAIRIGREHIGALVNTLAIAYVGAALPLLLLVQSATYGLAYLINSEIFATEIVRILIGSIGLILAVPITTLIATIMLERKKAASDSVQG